MVNFFENFTKKIKILTLNDCYETKYYGMWAQKANEIILNEKDSNTIFLKIFGGDFFFASKYSSIFEGHDMILASNASKFDAIGVGNHEFDASKQKAAELSLMSNAPIICSNLDKQILKEFNFKYRHSFIKNNIKFGVVSYVTQQTSEISPGAKGLKFKNLKYLFKTQKKFLLSCDIKILTFHDEVDVIIDFLNLNPKYKCLVDAIVTGHQHIIYADYIQRDNYKIPIVQAGENAQGLGYIEIQYNTLFKCLTKSFVEVKLIAPNYPETPEISVLTTWVQEISAPYFTKTIGTVTNYPLDGLRSNIRNKETNMGDLVTDAYLTTGTNIITSTQPGNIFTVENSGSIKNNSLYPMGTEIDGEIVTTIIPFSNDIVALEIIGRSNVNSLINYLATTSLSKKGTGGWLQISNNLLFNYVTQQYELIGGTTGETDKFYLVCTDFLAAGGDGYSELIKLNIFNIDVPIQISLTSYIENQLGGVISIPTNGGRIILP